MSENIQLEQIRFKGVIIKMRRFPLCIDIVRGNCTGVISSTSM